jgi:hypothetical protein
VRFHCAIRPLPHYRLDAFLAGMKRLGWRESGWGTCDVFVTWNRYGLNGQRADQVERRGGRVLVTENAAWGNGFAGDHWYTIARDTHNTAGKFPVGGAERWDALGVELAPWRPEGGEVVGLPQRGIGPAGVAMPRLWMPPGCHRTRAHPGVGKCVPLDQDLAHASKVVTWGSGAAIKALMWGIRVESHMPNWIGQQDNTDAGRVAMFRQLAHAQWRLSEITNGEPFARLVSE